MKTPNRIIAQHLIQAYQQKYIVQMILLIPCWICLDEVRWRYGSYGPIRLLWADTACGLCGLSDSQTVNHSGQGQWRGPVDTI
jgi:hypothetical protein